MAIQRSLGRDFIRMMAPILGIDKVTGIRRMTIDAEYNQATVVSVDMLPPAGGEITVDKAYPEHRRYEITVRPID